MAQLQETFLFQPTQIPNCSLWLDAADPAGTGVVPANGATVSSWVDKSGNGNTGTSAGSIAATYSSSLRAIVFSGTHGVSSTYFTIPDTSALRLTTPFTIYMSYSATALTPTLANNYGSMILLGKFPEGSGYPGWAYRARTYDPVSVVFTANYFNSAANQGDTVVTSVNVVDGTQKIIGLYQPGTTTLFSRVNGSPDLTLPLNLPVSSTVPLILGARNSTNTVSNPMNGSVNEILIFTGTLTPSQCLQIEGYLAWKWGLQGNLPANHPFKTYRPYGKTPFPTTIPPAPLITQAPILFAPTQISGCCVWLDAKDVYANGSTPANGTTISTWSNKGGSVNFTTLPGLNAPSFSNGGVYFSGLSNALLNGPNVQTTRDATFVFVTSIVGPGPGTTGNVNTMIDQRKDLTNALRTFYTGGAGQTWQIRDAAGRIQTSPGFAYTSNVPAIRLWRDTLNLGQGYVNGTLNYTASGTYDQIASDSYGIRIGAHYLSPDGANFYMYEFIVINKYVTDTEQYQIEGYLAWKWGLQASLPANHPFKGFYPFSYQLTALTPQRVSLSSWQPTRISGMNAWYDGADPLGTGRVPGFNTALSTWVDKSGNGRNASGGVSPTFVNGGVSFNGTSQYYTMSVPYSSNYSIFLVATNTTAVQCYYFSRDSLGGGREPTFIQGYMGAGIGLEWFEGADRATIATTPASPFLASIDHIQGTSIVGWYYGSQAFNISQTRAYAANAWDRLGTATNTVGFYGGTMKDLIFYSNVVTNQQRQQVEGYLAWKWGLQASLPANHPFKRFPPSP